MGKDFIKRQELIKRIRNIYRGEAKQWNHYYENLFDEEMLEEICEDEALRVGNNWADSFNKMLFSKDYDIPGNFAHVEINYEHDHKKMRFREVLEGLVNGTLSEEDTKEFKDWAVYWCFFAFGTFGLTYNFGCTLDEIFYEKINAWEEAHNPVQLELAF